MATAYTTAIHSSSVTAKSLSADVRQRDTKAMGNHAESISCITQPVMDVMDASVTMRSGASATGWWRPGLHNSATMEWNAAVGVGP